MMSLLLMQAFFSELDEGGRGALLEGFAALWGAEPGSATIVRASSNFLCSFERGGRRYSLRIAPPGSRKEVTLEPQLDFLAFLEGRGIPAHRLFPSASGRRFETVATPWGPSLATAFEWIEGELSEAEEFSDSRLRAWGGALARLHLASEDYPKPDQGLDLLQCLARARDRLPPGAARERRIADALLSRLRTLPRRRGRGGNWGLIHADFEADNLIWKGEEPWAIDFDELGPGWFAADLAFAARDLFGDRVGAFDAADPRFRLFLEGYREVRPLPEEELALVPLFLALNHDLHRLDIAVIVAGGSPPGEASWVANLRERLVRHLRRWDEELAAFVGP